jgi:hypothetical protein
MEAADEAAAGTGTVDVMGVFKGPSEGGSGGKRGHRNMEHWGFNDEVKDAARSRRRLDDQVLSKSEEEAFDWMPLSGERARRFEREAIAEIGRGHDLRSSAGEHQQRPSTNTYALSNRPVLRPPIESGQYRSRKVHRALARHGLVGSMGQVGTAADNAAAESFFALLQKNVLNTRRWGTRDQLRIAIATWIERTYNQRRRQTRLDRLTPTEYETIMTPTALQAA